jgi:AcrR family transcriptional regulator
MSLDTREQILDTAERLFADQGIGAVSLRSITAEAGVNLAAIHYYFGSKEALVVAVFDRRVVKLNEERLALLDEVERAAGDGPLPIEDLLRALYGPAIRFSQDPSSLPGSSRSTSTSGLGR